MLSINAVVPQSYIDHIPDYLLYEFIPSFTSSEVTNLLSRASAPLGVGRIRKIPELHESEASELSARTLRVSRYPLSNVPKLLLLD